MSAGTLSMWTIYDHPYDYPDCFVARRFEIGKPHIDPHPTVDVLTAQTLEALRDMLPPEFSVCMPRDLNDQPSVVETWL